MPVPAHMARDEYEASQRPDRPELPEGGTEAMPSQWTDTRLELLANGRRRKVLYYLHDETDDGVEFEELVDWVVRWEAQADREVPEDHRLEVTIALHHNHLPKLDDAGALDYDRRSRFVRYRGEDEFDEMLQHLWGRDPR